MTQRTIYGRVEDRSRRVLGEVEKRTREITGNVYRAVMQGGFPYDGPYEVTPGDEAQILQTAGKSLSQNVVIEAIPENYGKIGWNGAVLTVS